MSNTTVTTDLQSGTWTIDPVHSHIEFSVRHLMVSKVRGSFRSYSGKLVVPDDPFQSTLEVSIDAASIDTGDENRDRDLRGEAFLDVERYPTIEYRAAGVHQEGDHYVVEGDLTIHGVTRRVPLTVELGGVGPDPWGNTRAGFSATAEINRRDFGIDINMPMETGGVVVGDKVNLSFDVELVHSGS